MSVKHIHQFEKDQLLECGYGRLFGEGNAQLPVDNMLMLDRIKSIYEDRGTYGKGEIIAELDIKPELWFFQCHFPQDPVMPGCLGLDALWQLLGFYLAWADHPGKGRALGVGEVKFSGQVLPTASKVTYQLDIKRVICRKSAEVTLGLADGKVNVDDRNIYNAKDLRVGLFNGPLDF